MANEIIKPGSKDISLSEKLFLLNIENGRVFDWTAYLSVRKGFVDCTADGQPIDPKAVPGNHPWIKEQVAGLHGRLSAAGADDDTLYQVGQQLTADGKAKFKSLDYEKAKQYKLDKPRSAAANGALIRIYNKIDKMAEAAQIEIRMMGIKARSKLGRYWKYCD